ncbi:MAG: cyclic nucleotide-binding domain-containing protein [Myxococcaceae bacterium]
MLQALQSNWLLVGGAALVLLLGLFHALTPDPLFRRDARGAIRLLLLGGALRGLHLALGNNIHGGLAKALEVTWMAVLSFGVIRSVVSLSLWLVRSRERPAPKILRDVLDATLYVLVTLFIFKQEFNLDLSSLVAGSAIASVVLGLALQDTLGNLFAGLSLQLERPFEVGDSVSVGTESGRVLQLGWRATRLETKRREVITLPNNQLAKQTVKNFSRGNEPVGVDVFIGASYEAPPNRVKQVVAETLSEVPLILASPSHRTRTWAFEEMNIKYRIRFYVADYARANRVRDEVLTRLWYRLRREAIEIPAAPRTMHMLRPPRPNEVPLEARLSLLGAVEIFRVLNAEEREHLANAMVRRFFGAGERILEEGAAGQTFYVVASGTVAVTTRRGVEVTRLSRGQYFGEMSLLTGEPRSATVVAVEDSVLFELDRAGVGELFVGHPGLATQLSTILAERRLQLQAVANADLPPSDHPEANRILARLRQIFGLS